MVPTMPFGKTGHESTRILFGAAAFMSVSQLSADRTMEYLLEKGINHIDTAADYGDSEERIGPWMREHRDDFFLATKTGARTYDKAKESLSRSLSRLRTDHVDLLFIHRQVVIEPLLRIPHPRVDDFRQLLGFLIKSACLFCFADYPPDFAQISCEKNHFRRSVDSCSASDEPRVASGVVHARPIGHIEPVTLANILLKRPVIANQRLPDHLKTLDISGYAIALDLRPGEDRMIEGIQSKNRVRL